MLTGTVIRSLRSWPIASEKPSSAAGTASAGGGAAAGEAGGGGAAPIAAAAASGRINVFIGRPPIGVTLRLSRAEVENGAPNVAHGATKAVRRGQAPARAAAPRRRRGCPASPP